MCQMPRYDIAALQDLHEHCRARDTAWRREVHRFADYLAHLNSLWPR